MKQKKMRQKRIVGDVVRIDLSDGFWTYARVLDEATFAFYEGRVCEELPIDRIISLPVMFQVAVMDSAVNTGRWVVVGAAPLEGPLLTPQPKFMQDALRLDVFRIYHKGAIRPATKEECLGL